MSSKSLLYHPWLVSSLTALSFHTLRGSAWPMFLLCLPLWGSGLSVIFPKLLYESILFRKISFDHSFLSEGIDFSVFFEQFLLSSFIAFSLHAFRRGRMLRVKLLVHYFLHCSVIQYCERGQIFCLRKVSCIIPDLYHPWLLYHLILWGGRLGLCSCYATLSEGVDYQLFFQSCSMSPYFLGKSHSTIRSFLKGLISLYFLNSFFYHPSLLSHSMLLGGCGFWCQITCAFFSSLLCHSILWEGTDFLCLRKVSCIIPDLYHPWLLYHFILWGGRLGLCSCFATLSEGVGYQLFFESCSMSPYFLGKSYSTIRSFLKGLISLYFWTVSSIILHCFLAPCF